jgi:D-aspartate ligase
MQQIDTSTPVVLLQCQLGALGIMRTLGRIGVPVYGVDGDRYAPAMLSRYCRSRFVLPFNEDSRESYLEGLLAIGERLGRAVLIATSDETTQFVADHASALRRWFMFQENSGTLIRQLASKREMFDLATRHGVPTPKTLFPRTADDIRQYSADGPFPVMLKGIYGNRLQARTRDKMVIAHSPTELEDAYQRMNDPDDSNLMLQEYIPGGDDQVYIFNGYFNRDSECLVGFTGHKIRQFPVHVGCASLGECRSNDTVARTTTTLMKAVGYQGILDIGYRLDSRDGQYKVLDINPRVGQAFRLFVAENDHDVVRAMYFDFTGQPQPEVIPREGRRWLIEDYDVISSFHYYQEGSLTPVRWLKSFHGVQEAAWFSWRDPRPVLLMLKRLTSRALGWLKKRL